MNFEISSYLLILLLSLLYLMSNKAPVLIFKMLLFPLSLFYVISIRISGFDGDITIYAKALSSESFSLYYLKEYLYWLGSRYIYTIINNEVLSFIIIDLLIVSILFNSLKLFSAPKYSYFLILIIFPVIFGFQNTYRQLIGSSLLLLGLSFSYANQKGAFLSGIFAASAHNPAALLLPFSLGLFRQSFLFMIVSSIIIGGALKFLSKFESSSTSGGNFSLILSIAILIITMLLIRLSMRNHKLERFIGLFIALTILSFFSSFTLATSTSERISFYVLTILFPFLVVSVECRVRPVWVGRLTIVGIYTLPMFISQARSYIIY